MSSVAPQIGSPVQLVAHHPNESDEVFAAIIVYIHKSPNQTNVDLSVHYYGDLWTTILNVPLDSAQPSIESRYWRPIQ